MCFPLRLTNVSEVPDIVWLNISKMVEILGISLRTVPICESEFLVVLGSHDLEPWSHTCTVVNGSALLNHKREVCFVVNIQGCSK